MEGYGSGVDLRWVYCGASARLFTRDYPSPPYKKGPACCGCH